MSNKFLNLKLDLEVNKKNSKKLIIKALEIINKTLPTRYQS